jgi:C4-type Zn-finger protein
MRMTITDIESYSDFSNRCKALHKRMMQCKELGFQEIMTIEGLIYTYAKALDARREYNKLSDIEKKEKHKKEQEAVKFISEYISELKNCPLKFDIDKYLNK